MKTTKKHRRSSLRVYRRAPAYPNAADANYFREKLLDVFTAVISGVGFVAAMLFLVTMM